MMIPTCGSVLNKSRECDPHGYGQQLEAEEEDDSSIDKAPLPPRASFDNRNVVCNNQNGFSRIKTIKQLKILKKGRYACHYGSRVLLWPLWALWCQWLC